MPSETKPDNLRRLLEELEAGQALSQRALARRLGIALGRTNQLLRGLVEREWIEVGAGTRGRRRYSVTAAGSEARLQMTREYLARAMASFGPARDRIRDCLSALSAATDTQDGTQGRTRPSIVLHGPDGIAYIAYGCAVETGVDLVGFVGDGPSNSMLGLPIRPWTDLTPCALAGQRFDRLLIASLGDHDGIRRRLDGIGFPLDQVSWL